MSPGAACYKQSQYGRIILPFTVLRRLECELEGSKQEVLATVESTKALPEVACDKLLLSAADQSFYNTSKLMLDSLGENHIGDNLDAYVRAFSSDVREVFEHFNFEASISLLEDVDSTCQRNTLFNNFCWRFIFQGFPRSAI